MTGVSVVTTLFNERGSVESLLSSLMAQTSPPDEIVVVDGGSTDGTAEILDRLAAGFPALRVLHHPGGRSEGRNVAIEAARHELIACIDGGCVAEPGWLEHLVAPFRDPQVDWVAGFYRPVGTTLRSTCIGLVMVYVLDEVEPGQFLPSARSMAFRKEAWKAVGGFPEDLDFAEDTLFDERMLAAGFRPVFAGDAVVRWTPPAGYRALARTMFRWGRGDGLVGLRGQAYKRILAVYGGSILASALAAVRWPRALPVTLAPLGASVVRSTRHKYRWADGMAKHAHLPAAHVLATTSTMAGFLVGRARAARRGAVRYAAGCRW
jgi:glycosyltransferase involved in cell wall biosynthesis